MRGNSVDAAAAREHLAIGTALLLWSDAGVRQSLLAIGMAPLWSGAEARDVAAQLPQKLTAKSLFAMQGGVSFPFLPSNRLLNV